ncbi:MAG: aminodeoxychorismate/anthranilate synthase component II [Acidobacteria bacterium]|nr:aminodeoxychorismate/anthranilate synthase component II [Acidobacteriota bacterium]
MILVLDNYDSFTYNIVQYLQELGAEVEVRRNDAVGVEEIERRRFAAVVISPGPGRPEEAGITEEIVRRLGGKVPILGVCLGHQAIARVFGGRIVRAEVLMHGKTSAIRHDGRTIFAGLPDPFDATRYHSLIVERSSFPEALEVSATTGDGIVMGLRRKSAGAPLEGVQFHPESILTIEGKKLLANFLGMIAPC